MQKKLCFSTLSFGYTTRMTTYRIDDMEHIKQALADRNLSVVAKETGLNPHTLYRLTHKENPSKPHPSTIAVLTQYLFKKNTH